MERVDVIDVLCRAEADAAKNSHLGLGDPKCAEIMAARLVVAGLIEAEKEYDAAEIEMNRHSEYSGAHLIAIRAFHRARDRRRTALARITKETGHE